MMSSPSLFVQRVESSQFAQQTPFKSSQCTYRVESSPESRIATKVLGQGFPNWLSGDRDPFLFFGLHPISVGKQ